MDALTIIKIGGNVIDKPAELEAFLADFAKFPMPKILVHGGGIMASDMLRKLGIEPNMVDGRRITDVQTLKVAAMVYAGWINKDIVARLQAVGCQSVGLSGADGDSVRAVKRPPAPVNFGYVGDITPESVNLKFIEMLLESKVTPVFCAITHDGKGSLLNTNADTIASTIASAFTATHNVRLIYCFEKQGVLSDPSDDNSVIPELTFAEYENMKAVETAKAGMIAKLDNAFRALGNGVNEVVVIHAANLLSDKGTLLKL